MRIDRLVRRFRARVAVPAVGLVASATPQGVPGQGPCVPENPVPASAKEDSWYPEGHVRIRGKRYSLFAGANYVWFVAATSRARFGLGTWSPSVELYRPQRRGYAPLLELASTRLASGDSTASIAAVSLGARFRPVAAESARWLVAEFGLGVGPRVARIDGAPRSTVFGIGAQLGVEVRRSARVTTRYSVLPVIHGARLSTMAVSAVVHLPPFLGGKSGTAPPRTSRVASSLPPSSACADTTRER